MDDFTGSGISTIYGASELVQMDMDFPVHISSSNFVTGLAMLDNTARSTQLDSTENEPKQDVQPRKISRAQWDKIKGVIHERYIIQNCTLNELVSHMETEHSFGASKQQYVRKLKEWKFEKNRRNQDWSGISRALKRRMVEVEGADVYLNGRLIPSKKLKKEISRCDRPSLQTKYVDQLAPRAGLSPRTPDGFFIERHNAYSIHVSPPRMLPWFDFLDSLTTFFSDPDVAVFALDQQQSMALFTPSNRYNLLLSVFHTKQHASDDCRQGKTDDLAVDLATQLSPVLVERAPGDLDEALKEISTTQSPFKLCMLLSAYVVYLCTNYLAEMSILPTYVAMLKAHELVKAILERLLDAKDPTSQTFATILLHYSVAKLPKNDLWKGDLWLLQQLASKMAGIDVKLHSHETGTTPRSALHIAIEAGNIDAARFLLSVGSDPNQCLCDTSLGCCQEQNCLRPLDVASRAKGSIRLVDDLLKMGAGFNKNRILPSAIRNEADIHLVGKLIQAGASIVASAELEYDEYSGSRTHIYDDPLTAAICSGRIDIMERLIYDYNYPVNA